MSVGLPEPYIFSWPYRCQCTRPTRPCPQWSTPCWLSLDLVSLYTRLYRRSGQNCTDEFSMMAAAKDRTPFHYCFLINYLSCSLTVGKQPSLFFLIHSFLCFFVFDRIPGSTSLICIFII